MSAVRQVAGSQRVGLESQSQHKRCFSSFPFKRTSIGAAVVGCVSPTLKRTTWLFEDNWKNKKCA